MKDFLEEKLEHVRELVRSYGKLASSCVLVFIAVWFLVESVQYFVPRTLRVTFFDVGQGDAIFVQTPGGHDMLIDGGPNNKVLEGLEEKMKYSDTSIDVVVATHADADHITGLIPVFEKYNVSHVIESPVDGTSATFYDLARHVQKESSHTYVARRGDVIDFGDGVFAHVLYPGAYVSPKTDTNDASVSLLLVYGEHSFLLTGDLTSAYESQVVRDVVPKNVTVYKAGHHGSKTSSGEALLKRIKPEYVVISAGKNNRYGHPAPEALTRLEKHAQEILSTIDHGAISFVSDGRMLEVEKEK